MYWVDSLVDFLYGHKWDIINGIFELTGACFMWVDGRLLKKHKQIKGVFTWSRFFFLTWGAWNLIYYPFIDQWFSFGGGIALVLSNGRWCLFALKYRNVQPLSETGRQKPEAAVL